MAALLRSLGVWLAVMAAAVAVIYVVDAVPSVIRGTPRGVRRLPSLPALERAAGRPMPVPAYYPSSLEWPPGDQRLRPDGSAALWCRQRADGALWLVIATAPATAPEVASDVMPPASELQRGDGTVNARPAVVTRLRDASGALWHQVSWSTPRWLVVVRYRGTLDELMRIASGLSE